MHKGHMDTSRVGGGAGWDWEEWWEMETTLLEPQFLKKKVSGEEKKM